MYNTKNKPNLKLNTPQSQFWLCLPVLFHVPSPQIWSLAPVLIGFVRQGLPRQSWLVPMQTRVDSNSQISSRLCLLSVRIDSKDESPHTTCSPGSEPLTETLCSTHAFLPYDTDKQRSWVIVSLLYNTCTAFCFSRTSCYYRTQGLNNSPTTRERVYPEVCWVLEGMVAEILSWSHCIHRKQRQMLRLSLLYPIYLCNPGPQPWIMVPHTFRVCLPRAVNFTLRVSYTPAQRFVPRETLDSFK